MRLGGEVVPVIPQISSPVSGKSYSSNNLAGKQPSSAGEQFDIIQLTKPVDVGAAKDRDGGKQGALMAQKDFLSMSVKLAKDPTMAVESLKQLINHDLLAIAKANGYTELHGELESLMKSLFLNPGDLVAEILSQEKSTTMFGGDKFFDLLRQLAGSERHNSEELRNAIGNLLKAINFAQNQREILSALSSNMKFLSQYFSPNKALAEDLATLAARWGSADAPANFDQLKNETLFIINNVSDSLLNNERIQVLIPLIVHNLSRYNTNAEVLTEYFAALLTQVAGLSMREELTGAFDKLLQNLFGGNWNQEEPPVETPKMPSPQAEESKTGKTAFGTGENPVRQAEQPLQEPLARYIGENLEKGFFDTDTLDSAARTFLLGRQDGIETIKLMLGSLLDNPALMEALDRELAQITDISKLVEYLNDILRNLPDVPERQALYEYLTDVINSMAEKGELPVPEKQEAPQGQPPPPEAKDSTLKQLIEFVEKNIDHAAIKTINNYNASNLLQSLINAPGVFTPLAHYIIPLHVDGMNSFGELWVDADEGNESARASGGKAKYHLFLTFEVEAAGRFELDLYADGPDVNLSFFYPESFAEKSPALLGKVGKIIAQNGYKTKEIRTGPLSKPHDLTQVFPDILERRAGFNVTA